MEWPIPRRVLRRRQREALFVIERVFWEERFSEFGYDEEREVFFDHEGDVVFTRHYADRRLFEERGPESAAEEPGRAQSPGPVPEALMRPHSARGGARCSVALGDESG